MSKTDSIVVPVLRNWALRMLGWFLCLPAILLGPVAKLTLCDVSRPWVDGLWVNTWRAYKKYNAGSWLRRMISIYKNPDLTTQYLKILLTKKQVKLIGEVLADPVALRPLHDIQTDHGHHRERVKEGRLGKVPSSQFGPIILVGEDVHDGNHRVGALQEAGFSGSVPVLLWLDA